MILPPCTFRGRVVSQAKCWCSLNPPARLIASQTCHTCPHAGGLEMALFPVCVPIAHEAPTCVHRGEQVRTERINLCCGEEALPILQCAVHGECSIEQKTSKVRACVGCRDALSPEAGALPELTGPIGLSYFIWPRTETRELWLEQQQIIRAAFDRFDGPKRLYIATGDTSEGEIDPSGWDEIRVAPNDPQGREVPGWRWLMERAASDPGATVWLHAKGAYRGCPEQHLARWWELGYEAMLDVQRVRKALERSVIAGCFRRNTYAANLGVPWHFTGSMYSVRNDAITFPESIAAGWYAEAWPALIARRELAECVAFDGCGDLYQSKNWKEQPA